jgi:4-amino-4-deoxy-L-arabinose transferase-like glycosyltransferase
MGAKMISIPSRARPIQRLADRLLGTRVLATLWMAGLVLRWVVTVRYANLQNPTLWEFALLARNLYETGVYAFHVPGVPTAYMPPAYPILISLLYRVFGINPSAYVALALILLAFEAATPFLVAWITRSLWGSRAARVAFLLATGWPLFIVMSGRVNNVPMYTALMILAAGILVTPALRLPSRGALCGLTLGLYSLFRFEGVLMSLPFLGYLLRRAWVRERTFQARLAPAALFVAAFVIFIGPWIIRNRITFGRFALGSTGGFNLVRGHNDRATGAGRDPWPTARSHPNEATPLPTGKVIESLTYKNPEDEFTADDWYRRQAIAYVVSHPRREVELALTKIFYFLTVDWTHPISRIYVIWVPSLFALVAGFLHWVRTGRRIGEQDVLWLLFGTQMGIAVVFFVLPRYRMIVDFVPLVFLAGWIASHLNGGTGREASSAPRSVKGPLTFPADPRKSTDALV